MAADYDSTADTLKHIRRVSELMMEGAMQILIRAKLHDATKLLSPEKEMFDEFTPKLRESVFGSDEYKATLVEMGEALKYHYKKNQHHPEHYPQPTGAEITQMQSDLAELDTWVPEINSETGMRLKVHLASDLTEAQSRVNNMDLYDVLEMLLDWKAASERFATGDLRQSLRVNVERFMISPQLANILRNTIERYL